MLALSGMKLPLCYLNLNAFANRCMCDMLQNMRPDFDPLFGKVCRQLLRNLGVEAWLSHHFQFVSCTSRPSALHPGGKLPTARQSFLPALRSAKGCLGLPCRPQSSTVYVLQHTPSTRVRYNEEHYQTSTLPHVTASCNHFPLPSTSHEDAKDAIRHLDQAVL